jgi:hypothetical protein
VLWLAGTVVTNNQVIRFGNPSLINILARNVEGQRKDGMSNSSYSVENLHFSDRRRLSSWSVVGFATSSPWSRSCPSTHDCLNDNRLSLVSRKIPSSQSESQSKISVLTVNSAGQGASRPTERSDRMRLCTWGGRHNPWYQTLRSWERREENPQIIPKTRCTETGSWCDKFRIRGSNSTFLD